MHIDKLSDIGSVSIGYMWESKTRRVGFLRFLLFAILNGDWNRIHINPLTAILYKSNLRGLTCCGDLVTGMTAAGIHKALRFSEDVEIIATERVAVFKRPLHPRTKFRYRYTLTQIEFTGKRAECCWHIVMLDSNDRIISTIEWQIYYVPVEVSATGRNLRGLLDDFDRYPYRLP